MATVTAALRVRKGGSTVAHLVTDQGVPYSLAYTPETFQMGGITPKFGSIDRQGLLPLMGVDSQQLVTLQFTHPLVDPKGGSIGAQLHRLRGLARSGKRVRIVGWTPGGPQWWTIADLSIQVTKHTAGQQPAQADLSWSLVQYSNSRPKIGRVRPAQTTTASNHLNLVQTSVGTRRYTWRAGDTVYSIASEQLGDSSRWREIVELNPTKFPYGATLGVGSPITGSVIIIPAPAPAVIAGAAGGTAMRVQ